MSIQLSLLLVMDLLKVVVPVITIKLFILTFLLLPRLLKSKSILALLLLHYSLDLLDLM